MPSTEPGPECAPMRQSWDEDCLPSCTVLTPDPALSQAKVVTAERKAWVQEARRGKGARANQTGLWGLRAPAPLEFPGVLPCSRVSKRQKQVAQRARVWDAEGLDLRPGSSTF